MPPRAISLKTRLWATALLALFGSVALLFVSMKTIEAVKIRGPLYQDIISYKDLLADILPPPEYLIESYLVCFELQKAKQDERPELFKKLTRLEADFRDRNAVWHKALTHSGIRTALLDEATPPAFEFFKVLKDSYIPLMQQNKDDEARQVLYGPLGAAYQKHRAGIDKTVELANKEVLVVEATADSTLIGSIRSLILAAAAINILVLLLTFYSIRSIMTPMTGLTRYAKRVSSGDYDCTCDINAQNEIGNLAQVLSETVAMVKNSIAKATQSEHLAQAEAQNARTATAKAEEAKTFAEQAKRQGMFQAALKLEKVVNVVGSASEQLATQIEQSNKGAQTQAYRASEAATSMEQMNSTVLEVAQNASQTAETSSQAQMKAKEGAEVVRKVIQEIGQVHVAAMALKNQMTDLGHQSESIGQILNVISDIADQTNLLALNAAIEAARAGDAGRGFAVVADEVRKLAEKTMTATKQVGDAIKSVQACTRANIVKVDEAVTAISGATELAGVSGQALENIVQLVETASGQIQSIATAAEEQSAASDEINRAVDEVNTVAKETLETMNQASHAVLELSRQAGDLRTLIQELKSETQAQGA